MEVTFAAAALNRVFASVFPGEAMEAVAYGNLVVLTGTVSEAVVAGRMVEVARSTRGRHPALDLHQAEHLMLKTMAIAS